MINFQLACLSSKQNEHKGWFGASRSSPYGNIKFTLILLSAFKKYDLLKADNNNKIQVKVTGARKREVGLILPGRCSMRTKNRGTGRILDENLQKK